MTEAETDRRDVVSFPLLGMDVSASRIGLAIVDHPDTPPQPWFTYHRTTRARDLEQCTAWITRYHIGGVVMGLPLNMDGTPGSRAQWMRRFARDVQEAGGVQVFLQDERLSTVEAEEMLAAQGVTGPAASERVDAVAAALILQRFLQEHARGQFGGG